MVDVASIDRWKASHPVPVNGMAGVGTLLNPGGQRPSETPTPEHQAGIQAGYRFVPRTSVPGRGIDHAGLHGVGTPAPQAGTGEGGWGTHPGPRKGSPFVEWRRARGVTDAEWAKVPMFYKALYFAKWGGH